MSQPTIESVIEEKMQQSLEEEFDELVAAYGKTDVNNLRRRPNTAFLFEIKEFIKGKVNQERKRCVEIVESFVVDVEELEDEFGIYDNSNRTCRCIAKAINSNE
jgi:hypothetical protein